jgi:hypothetical protein
MADIVETVPFNFDELYEGLKTKFEEKGYDTEEGSNTSQLITAMTYLTSMLNVNTAVNINETILPLATRRDSALQDARALGYEVKQKRSYNYRIRLELEAGDHTIPKYSKFVSGDKSYYYLSKQLELSDVEEGYTIELPVIEGTLYNYSDYISELSITTTTLVDDQGIEYEQYFVDVPFVDVEHDNGLEVYVTYYDDFGSLIVQEEWKRSKRFMVDADTVLNKEYIRLDDIEFNTPRIYFKLAGIGEGIRAGSTVEMNVLTTSGVDGAIEDITDTAGLENPIPNSEVTGITLVSVGQDQESIESIKANAPLFHNTANRAVTKLDYEAICNRENPVKTSLVWGGDDEYPRCPGHIWFSFLPQRDEDFRVITATNEFNTEYVLQNKGDYNWDYSLDSESEEFAAQLAIANEYSNEWFLQNNEIRSFEINEDGDLIKPGVWDILDNYKIPTLEFHNRHPIYLDFEYDISILKYNIADSKALIHNNIFNAIDGFFTGVGDSVSAESFEIEYFHSSLEKRIDTVLTDVTGFTNSVSAKLTITSDNISSENSFAAYKDLYIPLAIPFEEYFDNDGYLMYDVLPNIDTPDFIEYNGETGHDLFVDWSEVQAEIDAETAQESQDLIIAPIRVKTSESVTLTDGQQYVPFTEIEIIPDDPTTLDNDEVSTYNNVRVWLNDVEIDLVELGPDQGFYVDSYDEIFLQGFTIVEGDVIYVETNTACGLYHLFNSYKKYIIVQLFVDGTQVPAFEAEANLYDQPKSYLTTVDGFYDFTVDEYYLTTEGYRVVDEGQVNALSGNIIRSVSPSLYFRSPLKYDLFLKGRTLNFNYNTSNFMTTKNVIPRLSKVTFATGA